MLLPDSLAALSANIVATLATGLAGGVVLTGAVWACLRLIKGLNATTRFWIWWGALGAVVALLFVAPTVPFETSPPEAPATEQAPAAEGTLARLSMVPPTPPTESNRPSVEPRGSAFDTRGPGRRTAADRGRETAGVTEDQNRASADGMTYAQPRFAVQLEPAPPEENRSPQVAGEVRESGTVWTPISMASGWIPVAILAGLLLIASFRMLKVAHGCLRLQRIKSRARRLSPALNEQLKALVHRYGIRRRVRLRHSPAVPVPTLLGMAKPTIIIPTELADHLTTNEFKHVLLHELGHVRRWDDWTNLLQKIIGALLFFHPAIWLINRQLGLEREIACDDWVIARTGRIRPYAVCLTKLVSIVPWTRRAVAAPGLLWSKSQFSQRIEVLLNKKRNALPRLSKLGIAGALAVLALVVVHFGRVPPVVAVTESCSALKTADAETCVHPVSCDYEHLVLNTATEPEFLVSFDPVTAKLTCETSAHKLTMATPRPPQFDNFFAQAFPVDVQVPSPRVPGSITYEELVALFEIGITGDYVRMVRKVAPGFRIDDLVRLRRAGVELSDLEELCRAGRCGITINEVIRIQQTDHDLECETVASDGDTEHLSFEQIATLRRYGIPAGYFNGVMEVKMPYLAFDDVVAFYNNGVTTDYLEDLDFAGMNWMSAEEIIQLRNHGVSVDFIEAANEYGFHALTVEDITGLVDHGVSEGLLEDLDDAGIENLTPAEVVDLLNHGVKPDFMRTALDFWRQRIELSEVIRLRNYGVSEGYLEDLQRAGFDNLTSEQVSSLLSHGVSADFAEAVDDFGFSDYRVQDIIDLRNAGVCEDYLEDIGALDMDLGPQDVIMLYNNGVTADFIRELKKYGYQKPSANQIIKIQRRGLSQTVESTCSSSGAAN